MIHLMTGPPSLGRNGGIWKRLKVGIGRVSHPPRVMAQALHFVSYDLSLKAWTQWFPSNNGSSGLSYELARAYGPRRDVFVDSGGFQLLHADKIDLSKWDMKLDQESIFRLQMLYGPQRVASLDSPIPPTANDEIATRLSRISIRNATWLAQNASTSNRTPRPYLVVHGRSPNEVRGYLKKLERQLPAGWLHGHEYGMALGSQVPLSGDPGLVVSNIGALLGWMSNRTPSDADLHVFGVGDAITGEVARGKHGRDRSLSYDNSTYVQKAFRLRIYDNSTNAYVDLNPAELPECECFACTELSDLGEESMIEILSGKPYSRHEVGDQRWTKSDVLSLVALHNLRWWRPRLKWKPRAYRVNTSSSHRRSVPQQALGYRFPLPGFEPASPNLLMLPCTKWRPYNESMSHRRVKSYLAQSFLIEGRDYDRVTLSGMYGPVHWKDEEHPAILSYDFTLTAPVSSEQLRRLKFRTASILGVLYRRYQVIVAILRSSAYAEVFGPVTEAFGGTVVRDPRRVPQIMSRTM